MSKPSSFGDKIGKNIQHQKDSKTNYGYLNLPSGVPVLKLKEGVKEVVLDFLPYEVTDAKHPDRDPEFDIAMPETLWFRRPIKIHNNVGSKKEKCICLKSVGKKCPICDYQDKRRKEKAEKEEIKELYPKSRSLYVVIPLGMDKVEEIPHIWDMSDKLFQEILNEELETDDSNRVFPDLENGKTLVLKVRWKELGENSFPDVRSITFEDRDPYKESILKKVPNLDNVLKVLSYEELERKFFEIEEEEDGGKLKEDKEETTERRRRPVEKEEEEETPRRRRSAEPEKEEEEEEKSRRHKPVEEEEEEKPTRTRKPAPVEEEKEEKPTRTKKPVKEEEEEEKPTRSKPAGAKTSSNECPHGFKFGVDADTKEACETCNIWGKCLDKKEGK